MEIGQDDEGKPSGVATVRYSTPDDAQNAVRILYFSNDSSSGRLDNSTDDACALHNLATITIDISCHSSYPTPLVG